MRIAAGTAKKCIGACRFRYDVFFQTRKKVPLIHTKFPQIFKILPKVTSVKQD
jgi:hypothetical protein